jgi:DNA-binding XRE family transcriptional regulator
MTTTTAVTHARADVQVRTNLRRLRMARGWSRENVGARIGLAASTVSAHEKGARQLKADWLPVYAAAFGVRVHDLFDPNVVEIAATRTAVGGTR